MKKPKITSRVKIKNILDMLDELYPFNFKCFLNFEEPWQLLIATILSAQCTDDRVNQVTEVLFKKYPTLSDFAGADFNTLSQDIRSTGFFRMKAKHIIESAGILMSCYQGEIPACIESLTALPGVGRKTANVVRGHIFRIPSIVVDTHVMRVSFRLGLTNLKDPVKIEFQLMDILPKSRWIAYNQQIITHGRAVCTARSPKCDICQLKNWCSHHPLRQIQQKEARYPKSANDEHSK